MNKKTRQKIGALAEEKAACLDSVELELSGLVNWLRAHFPGAPDRLLWAVAKFEPNVCDKVRGNLREVARLQRRIAALKRRGKSARGQVDGGE